MAIESCEIAARPDFPILQAGDFANIKQHEVEVGACTMEVVKHYGNCLRDFLDGRISF